MKGWIKANQHAYGIRQALDLTQATYGLVRRLVSRDDRPAIGGGWPVRLVPMPPPRPFTRFERRALRRAARAQSTSFFDGEPVRRFESMLAERFGCRHALAVSSGTSALHTALMAARVGPGDEVIVPAMTYVATAMAVMHQGAVPVFVDADPETWNIDPARIEEAVCDRTRAIIPVHIAGVACDMEAIGAIAERHGLFVIEDAAHAHGSTWRGKALGTVGHLGCFSFGSPKNITTGEGGAVMTDDPELFARARIAMNLGESAPDGGSPMEHAFFNPETRLEYRMVGWNYRMSTLQAALGIGQLERFDKIRAARTRNGAFLHERLGALEGVRVQHVPPDASPCYYTFPFELEEDCALERSVLLQGLAREKIDVRLWSNLPLATYEIFGQTGEFPVAERLCARSTGMRTDPSVRPAELADMVLAIRRLLEWSRSKSQGS
ncbi:MAG TPA: DegT/DnrJ/EryC1/StrS family aminotransferase [Planctomycetota bacterium]|jgi:perosamine synthetase|nr:DegT/DnrJ/EryC1/StrS family aminotransferase [Planctomycetota bacterium]